MLIWPDDAWIRCDQTRVPAAMEAIRSDLVETDSSGNDVRPEAWENETTMASIYLDRKKVAFAQEATSPPDKPLGA